MRNTHSSRYAAIAIDVCSRSVPRGTSANSATPAAAARNSSSAGRAAPYNRSPASVSRTLRVVGIDILRAALLQPRLVVENRFELLAPDTVFLSASAAEQLGLSKDDRLHLVVGQGTISLRVAGIVPGSSLRGVAALADIATAQWRLERLGELNRLDIRLAQGADRGAVMESIRKLLPPGVHVAAVETLEQASGYPSRSYRVNLNVLALVALFTFLFILALLIHFILLSTDRFNWIEGPRDVGPAVSMLESGTDFA